jgi:kinesin family protein 26
MEPYASLRHPDGASDPNIQKSLEILDKEEKIEVHIKENPLAEICETELSDKKTPLLSQYKSPPPHLPLLPVSTPEAYDSGHDSTPRASKHSGMSRRAESGYHSVATATVRDSDESSFSSAASRHRQKIIESRHEKATASAKKKSRQDKSLCQWLRNPFTCTYPDTEGDVSDF